MNIVHKNEKDKRKNSFFENIFGCHTYPLPEQIKARSDLSDDSPPVRLWEE